MAQLPQDLVDAAQHARIEVRKLARQTRIANKALAEYDSAITQMLDNNHREEHSSHEHSSNGN